MIEIQCLELKRRMATNAEKSDRPFLHISVASSQTHHMPRTQEPTAERVCPLLDQNNGLPSKALQTLSLGGFWTPSGRILCTAVKGGQPV